MTLSIIPRAKWGARYARGFGPAPLPAPRGVYLHHSVTVAPDLVWVDADRDGVEDDEERAMRSLEDIGQSRFGGGISYTFAVMPSGRVYEGHGIDRSGAHTKGLNGSARAIVLVGDYSSRPPTEAQRDSVAELLVFGETVEWWPDARLVGGHRQAPGASTACPGDAAFRTIPDINQRAIDSKQGGGFLMALSAKDQADIKYRVLKIPDHIKDLENVILGTAFSDKDRADIKYRILKIPEHIQALENDIAEVGAKLDALIGLLTPKEGTE